MFEHMCATELFQGPVVLTFSIARDGFDLEFETSGCAAGRARAFSVFVYDYLNICFVKHHEEGTKSIAANCTEAHVGATVVCRRALVTWEVWVVKSPEKYVLLRAKVLEMNSKSLEVDGAEERRLLRGALGD